MRAISTKIPEAIANLVEVNLSGVSHIDRTLLRLPTGIFLSPAAAHQDNNPCIDQDTALIVQDPSPILPTQNIVVIARRMVAP